MGKFIETESTTVFTRNLRGEGNGELLFNGYRVSVWDGEKILEMDSSDGHSAV